MRDTGQLLLVVGLALMILVIGANETTRCSAEPRIMVRAQARLAQHQTAPWPDEDETDPSAPLAGRDNDQSLFDLVFGDLSRVLDTTGQGESALREQYGEWGRLYKADSLLANPQLRALIKKVLAAGQHQ